MGARRPPGERQSTPHQSKSKSKFPVTASVGLKIREKTAAVGARFRIVDSDCRTRTGPTDCADRQRRGTATMLSVDECEMHGCRAGALSGGIADAAELLRAAAAVPPHAPSRCPPSAFSRCCEQQDRRSLSARHNSGGAVCLK